MDTDTVDRTKTSVWKQVLRFCFFVKDTPGMFLLHGRLGRVDGFADAAQLRGEQMTGMNLGRLGVLLHPPTTDMTAANSQVVKR